MDTASRWSWRKKLALQVALLPLLVLAIEGGYRLLLVFRGQPYDGAAARVELEELVSSMRDTIPTTPETGRLAREAQSLQEQLPEPEPLVLHPYFGYEREPSIAVVEDESKRFRRGDFDASFNVLIVGGSVAGIFGRRGTERLGELLRADPRLTGREVRFFGHGRGSFKQPQQSFLVQFLLGLGYRLDAVINIDGFNELALGNKNAWDGAHPLYPSAIRYAHLARGGSADPADVELLLDARSALREAATVSERAVATGSLRSAILGRRALVRAHAARNRFAAAQEAYGKRLLGRDADAAVRGPGFARALPDVLALIVEGWVSSSRDLQALCTAHGITYLHVLQPTMHDEGSKVLTEQERQKDNAHESWREAIRPGYPMLRAAGARLAAEGVRFLDGSMLFRDVADTMYFDACHFRIPGNVLLAERIAPGLLAALPAELPVRE
jgi:hypothetical protein